MKCLASCSIHDIAQVNEETIDETSDGSTHDMDATWPFRYAHVFPNANEFGIVKPPPPIYPSCGPVVMPPPAKHIRVVMAPPPPKVSAPMCPMRPMPPTTAPPSHLLTDPKSCAPTCPEPSASSASVMRPMPPVEAPPSHVLSKAAPSDLGDILAQEALSNILDACPWRKKQRRC